jgi:uncharacterized protein
MINAQPTWRGLTLLLLLSALCTRSPAAESADTLKGHWVGDIKLGGIPFRLVFSIAETNGKLGGAFTSLYQSATKIPLSAATVSNRAVRLEVSRIGGVFDGKLNDTDNGMSGTWSQGAAKLSLTLRRNETEPVLRRPQVPKKPYPYREEEVVIPTKANGVKLAGTFTVPTGSGPHPAVVLISGSGPQDRDESIMGHRPFLVLADHLTRQGIAVLRHDDRGVGRSTGNHATATTADFADDTRDALAWLRARKEVDPKRTGLIGHSEGGIIAPLVAAKEPGTAFIVLLAGVGVPMKDLLLRQVQDFARLDKADEARMAAMVEQAREIHRMLVEELDDATLEKRVRAMVAKARSRLSPEELARAGDEESSVAMSLQQIRLPWQRWAIRYDPAPTLRSVNCPVLALNGDKDIQVAATENIEAIARGLTAGGNTKVKTAILPGLNHLFQTCQTGALSEYGEIEETMSPAALTMVSEWIKQIVTP